MEKMKVLKLAIELTRKCNMKCAHCFRGDAQNIDIDKRYIEKLFNFISEVRILQITGGEPSLNIDGMKHLIDTIRRKNVTIYELDLICNL